MSADKRRQKEEHPAEDDAFMTPLAAGPGDTPLAGGGAEETPFATPGPAKKRSRWDTGAGGGATPSTPLGGRVGGMTPAGATPLMTGMAATPGATPIGATGMAGVTPSTPYGMPVITTPAGLGTGVSTPLMTPGGTIVAGKGAGGDSRTKPLTELDLDQLLPKKGYEVVKPPPGYEEQRKLLRPDINQIHAAAAATPTPGVEGTPFYQMPPEATPGAGRLQKSEEDALEANLGADLNEVSLKAEDVQFFSSLLKDVDESELSADEQRERKIAILLLKIKNGTPPLRRAALKELTSRAVEFGPGPLFDQILPLMMQSSLEDQERHLLVKVIDRVLYRLDDKVRPYVHKILVVIEPLLIDEDYFARVEGREIISNLAKAAGLATMIATMRPDIDHPDEYVRNTTARAFAVVASALGIPSLILFLRAVCQSKKSWQARHTGIKIVQQIAILMGCAVLPHLKQLVEIIAHGLQDEQQKVRTITALAIAAMAEAAAPYGIEAFDCVLRPLWKGITEHRGKGLAAFLKAIGMIIPLMDPRHADYYTREVMVILVREFSTPDEEMKKIVLQVVKMCVATEGVSADYIRQEILLSFISNFWIVRNSLDKRNLRLVVDTSLEISKKIGASEVLAKIVEHLKDPSEPYRRMTIETVEIVVCELGVEEISTRLEEHLIDGLLYAFQEQSSEDATTVLNGIGSVINALGRRVKPYLPQIAGVVRWHLNTPSARVRQMSADLISRVAVVLMKCDEEAMLAHLGMYLYEYLGEEYPEVLGSILGALKAIVNVIGMQKMQPPIKDLLPRLTPVLKNRHEKVQENVIDLVGRISDRGGDLVSPNEWDRICFDLLELLKAHKKAIRRATVNTFGYIARTIGPHDVVATLLNNLRVQERQLRVCTTVAIAIVAETCMPYTVLPALMNEYRTPECNVQNGVLKALSFLFEYIGEMGKDYIYSVAPLIEDALSDRDMVHRQTAAWACKHLALGVQGLSCEDVLQHLMNYVWPNIFETSPHLIQAVFDAVDGFRISLGPAIVLYYLLQGMYHPARRVRDVYWRLYNNVYLGHQDSLVAFYPALPLSVADKGCHVGDSPPIAADPRDQHRGYCEMMMML